MQKSVTSSNVEDATILTIATVRVVEFLLNGFNKYFCSMVVIQFLGRSLDVYCPGNVKSNTFESYL